MPHVYNTALGIIQNCRIKSKLKAVLEGAVQDLADGVLILIDKNKNADIYWSELSFENLRQVIKNLDEELENCSPQMVDLKNHQQD